MRWGDKLHNSSGFRVSRDTAFSFAFGYILLVLGSYALLGFEFYLRVPDLIGFYLWEAMLAMLGPFILYGIADIYVMEQYRETGFQIRNNYVVQMIMDDERCEQIRRSTRFHPLLMWLRPRPVRNVRSELAGIALWFGALTDPEGSRMARSMRDPLMLGLGGWILCVVIPVLLLPALVGGGGAPRWLVLIALALAGLGCLMAGMVMLKRSAVQMALGDFLRGETHDRVL
ncbi:MAG: hypothetical protein H7A35_00315 [Planctomycetales bacterium]|nr:hypothetical protein [bacterium]UNM08506.1 MAG: hypothetical protein H7A35_00315 [Planctomycetales bacterium]